MSSTGRLVPHDLRPETAPEHQLLRDPKDEEQHLMLFDVDLKPPACIPLLPGSHWGQNSGTTGKLHHQTAVVVLDVHPVNPMYRFLLIDKSYIYKYSHMTYNHIHIIIYILHIYINLYLSISI